MILDNELVKLAEEAINKSLREDSRGPFSKILASWRRDKFSLTPKQISWLNDYSSPLKLTFSSNTSVDIQLSKKDTTTRAATFFLLIARMESTDSRRRKPSLIGNCEICNQVFIGNRGGRRRKNYCGKDCIAEATRRLIPDDL